MTTPRATAPPPVPGPAPRTAAAPPAVPPPGARVVWADGRLTTPEEAVVPALDHGLVTGDGVFESLKVTDDGAFALRLHLARLARSAAGMGLEPPDEAVVRRAVRSVLDGVAGHRRPGGTPWVLRVTWTAGPGPLGSSRPGTGAGTLVVAGAPVPPAASTAAAVTAPWTRNERSAVAGLKTTSYAENVVALRHAQARGASEALLANTRGELCEGTGSNVAVVLPGRRGTLLTPPLGSGCLAGTTRLLLLRWAADEGLALREEVLPAGVLDDAAEVLLLSSLRDVQVVTSLDGRRLEPGPVGRRAAELFARRSAAEPDPPL